MRSAFALLLTVSMVSVAVGGVLVMTYGSGHSHAGCIAAIITDQTCPENDALFGYLAFHLEAWRGITLALVLIASFGLLTGRRQTLHILAINGWRKPVAAAVFTWQRELIRWLALHENSPNWT
ncbi:MAG: hypothetical protein HY372_02500 [Candidatus Andersenbacteria bacterium]|nr:hypothetical protein [Candidatus Andersenbacteria bacterium]